MRQRRYLEKDATYHVCALINRQEMIFQTGDDLPEKTARQVNNHQIKELFMNVMNEAKTKYSFSIKHFCIMGNHIHLLIKPLNNESLSSIMQWILSVFAIRYNRRFQLKGHVWYDRFKSRVIQSFQQLVNTFIYISNNPIRAMLAEHPLQYKYSGLHHIANKIFTCIEPPDHILQEIIDEYLLNFSLQKWSHTDFSIGFFPKKR